ncbi:MAG: helix-turn-helix domain-containing protein [Balneolaceae bacterium]|nr:helix-turn-helix domain-containing protein [Balneolaceae bacterium]
MPSLGNDLALIRKHRGLSLEDVRNATKIPPHILSSIEDDSLFGDMEEHKTYLRSYVRSYAKALRIDEETILEALDRQEEGRYEGLLQKKEKSIKGPRFQLDEEDAGEHAEEAGDSTEVERKAQDEQQQADGEDETADEEADRRGDMVHDHAPKRHRKASPLPETSSRTAPAAGEKENKNEDTSEGEATGAESPSRVPPPPDVTSVDWADMGKKFTPLQSRPRLWIGLIIAAVILAAAAAWYIWGAGGNAGGEEQDNGGQQPTSEQQAALTPDSLQLDLSQEPAGAAGDPGEGSLGSLEQEAESLPDTLVLAIYAAYGQLEPVRVYSDVMNATNPYWIEQGEAFTFAFVEEIYIRGQFSQMELLMNGHPIPDFRNAFYNSDTGMLEIHRDWFGQDPIWLQPPPDSLEMDAPPPDTIRERPTFN